MSNFICILSSCSTCVCVCVWLWSRRLPDKSTYTEQSQDMPSSLPPSLSSCVFLTSFLKEHQILLSFFFIMHPFFFLRKSTFFQPKGTADCCLGTKEEKTLGGKKHKKQRANKYRRCRSISLKCIAYFSSKQEHLLICILSFFFLTRRREGDEGVLICLRSVGDLDLQDVYVCRSNLFKLQAECTLVCCTAGWK